MTRIVLSWSGGKDSWLALQALNQAGEAEVVALMTTFTEGDERVGMHGVRRALLQAQAQTLGLPLVSIVQPPFPANDVYERRLSGAVEPLQKRGIDTIAYGDLFLEDIRQYRDALLARLGMQAIYPIWQRDTSDLAQLFISQAKAVLVCVDTQQIDAEFVGREYDLSLLADLPPIADPCGEAGEFHTFVYAAPDFAHSLSLKQVGQFIQANRFMYADLMLDE